MAISGSFYGKTSNPAIKPKITWQAQASVDGNYSDVTATLSYSRTDGYKTYGRWEGSLTINGDQKSISGNYVEITKNSNTVTITHSVRVAHADDGKKTITISATGRITDTTLTGTVISGSVVLENIPRAATIAATDAAVGSVSLVTIHRTSQQYTYVVSFAFGGLFGYLTPEGISAVPVSFQEATLPFRLPEAFYYEIPDSASGVCRLTCTTYSGETCIGQPQSTDFLVRTDAAECGPKIELMAEDINPVTLALTGDKKRFIRYGSWAHCAMESTGRHGAAILEQRIGGILAPNGKRTIGQIGTDSIRFSARDSRGYSIERTLQLDMVPYFPLTGRVFVRRTDATGGEAVLRMEGNFYNGSFGALENRVQIQYQVNGGQWLDLEVKTQDDSYCASTILQNLDYTRAHDVQIRIWDALESLELWERIQPGIPVFDWGEGDFQFHVPVSMEKDMFMGGNRICGLGQPEADTDAVPKSYADGKCAVHKLWANDTAGCAFAEQTLSLQLEGYDALWIRFLDFAEQPACHWAMVEVGETTVLGAASIRNGGRRISVSTTGISFVNGFSYSAYNDADSVQEDPTCCIPVCIYGICGMIDRQSVNQIGAICGTFLCGTVMAGQ